MSIGGLGSTPSQYDLGAEQAPEAVPQQNGEAAPARGGSPAAAQSVWQAIQKDPAASMLEADLQGAAAEAAPAQSASGEAGILTELDDVDEDINELHDELESLYSAGGSSGVEGMSLEAIEDRIAWIEGELDFLYEYEGLLLDELADPNLGIVDSFWAEYDLWDVQFDIGDLEAELAGLKGEQIGRQVDSLWSDFASLFAPSIEPFLNVFRASANQRQSLMADASRDEARRDVRDIARQRRESADLQQRLERARSEGILDRTEVVRVIQGGPPRPVMTEEVVTDARGRLEPALARLQQHGGAREALVEIRTALGELRGARPHHPG